MTTPRAAPRPPGARVGVVLAWLAGLAVVAWSVGWILGDAGARPGGHETTPEATTSTSREGVLGVQPERGGPEASPSGVEPLEGLGAAEEAARWVGGNLRLRVVEAGTGRALQGARLSLYAARGSRETGSELLDNPIGVPDAIADGNGRALLDVPPGLGLRLIASGATEDVARRGMSIAPLGAHERREVLVELATAAGSDYWGRLLDANDGRPVVGAEIVLFSGAPGSRATQVTSTKRPAGTTSSDARGLFVVRLAPWTAAYVHVEAPGYGPVLAAVTTGHADPAAAEDLVLTASAGLDAEVLDLHGAPLKGATLTLSARSFDLAQPQGSALLADDPRWSEEIGWDGRVAFRDLPASALLTVEIALEERVLLLETEALVLTFGEIRERTWRLARRIRLTGRVLDQRGAAVADRDLWLAELSLPGREPGEPCYFTPGDAVHVAGRSRTDAAGWFEFRDVPAGTWLVGPAPRMQDWTAVDPDEVTAWAEVVVIPPDEPEHEVTLHVARALTIEGEVIGPDGSLLAARLVRAFAGDGTASLTTRSDPEGAFVLGPLLPGAWTLQADGGDGAGPSEAIEAQAGTAGHMLHLGDPAVLSGRLVGADGEDLPAARVVAWTSGPTGPRPVAASWSEPDDGFHVDGLGAGRYDLAARTGDGRVALLRGIVLAAGGRVEDLQLVLVEGARLRIGYDGAERSGRYTVSCSGSVVAVGDVRAGTSETVTVPPGPVEVTLTAGGRLLGTRTVQVGSDGRSDLVFTDT